VSHACATHIGEIHVPECGAVCGAVCVAVCCSAAVCHSGEIQVLESVCVCCIAYCSVLQ